MTFRLLACIMLIQSVFVFSQHIKIQIDGSIGKKAAVFSLSGEKTAFVDSIQLEKAGDIEWNALPAKYHTGLYRVSIKNTSVDFVYDGNDVSLRTNFITIADSMVVSAGLSNRLYYSFRKLQNTYKLKSELLQVILARFPKDDEYYKTTKERYFTLQNEYLHFVNEQSQQDPKSFIARYIRSAQLPIADPQLPIEKQLSFLRAHALDNVNFNDVDLTNSDLFTNKSIEYLMLYRNPQLSKEMLEKEFTVAVDSLLIRAKINPFVYSHITEYLVDGFKKFGFDHAIDYILENYVIKDDICLDQKLETTLQRRMDQARKLKIGMTSPNIALPDTDGKIVELNAMHAAKTLLIFYASWCPHCKDLLPNLAKFYKEQKEKNLEIIAISIDTNRTDWLQFLISNHLEFTNVCDLKGWSGKAANDYFIYATPTLFLLNKKLEILAKPAGIEELRKFLN